MMNAPDATRVTNTANLREVEALLVDWLWVVDLPASLYVWLTMITREANEIMVVLNKDDTLTSFMAHDTMVRRCYWWYLPMTYGI